MSAAICQGGTQSWEQRIRESVAAQNAGAVGFAPHYFTSATRDLHRAVEWFSHLKKTNCRGIQAVQDGRHLLCNPIYGSEPA